MRWFYLGLPFQVYFLQPIFSWRVFIFQALKITRKLISMAFVAINEIWNKKWNIGCLLVQVGFPVILASNHWYLGVFHWKISIINIAQIWAFESFCRYFLNLFAAPWSSKLLATLRGNTARQHCEATITIHPVRELIVISVSINLYLTRPFKIVIITIMITRHQTVSYVTDINDNTHALLSQINKHKPIYLVKGIFRDVKAK